MELVNELIEGINPDTLIYPGKSGSSIRRERVTNLSMYSADSRTDGGQLVPAALHFDIERIISWNKNHELLPFKYSTMIDGDYPIQCAPTKEKFIEGASQITGFVICRKSSGKKTDFILYNNSKENIFTNWQVMRNIFRKGKRIDDLIRIGVIQNKPALKLKTVTKVIIPYAVSVFNRLNPELELKSTIVRKSIDLAMESDKLIPNYGL